MSFVPPMFSKIGKTCSDLLAKKWDAKKDEFKHQLNVVSKAPNGVTITSTAFAEDAAVEKLSGKVVLKKEDKSIGEATLEFATSLKTKATFKLSKLLKGLTVSGEGEVSLAKAEAKTPACCALGGKLTGEYAQENAAGALEYDHTKNNASFALTGGFDGLSVGGQLNLNTKLLLASKDPKSTTPAPACHSFLAGVQYEEGDLTFALATEKEDDIAFSALHKLSKTTAYGVRALVSKEASLAFGGEYALDAATSTKAKIQVFNNKEYILSGYLQHKLADPKLTLGFSSQWAPLSSSRAKDNAFAVNVSLGDL